MALSNAEKQRRWREKRNRLAKLAEDQQLRNQPVPTQLEADIRKRLEAEFAQRLDERERMHKQEIDALLWSEHIARDQRLARVLVALSHPDTVQHPEAKEQLAKVFQTLEPAVTLVRKREEQRLKQAAEQVQKLREQREARSRRSKEAAARRKAKQAQ